MKLDRTRVEHYLARRHGRNVRLLELRRLTDSRVTSTVVDDGVSLKQFGYGEPILVRYRMNGTERQAVMHTMAENAFGHERRADRAAGILLSYDTYNTLPQHVQALDVGAVTTNAGLTSLADADEFFLLTEFVEGEPYARDLQRLRDAGTLNDLDVERARRLAAYLAEIHSVKKDDIVLYRRRIRDLVGSGEGVMGLTDSYPCDYDLADTEWLKRIEVACVRWRWHLKTLVADAPRLAQVHGDFHPFNVLFRSGVEFSVLDRSRGAWGEPADDVSCMTINYLFFSLQRSGALEPPFERLWTVFWDTYLDRTGDDDILAVIAPFFAWRGLVIASPVWYNVETSTRRAVFRFIERVLREDTFDPTSVDEYIR